MSMDLARVAVSEFSDRLLAAGVDGWGGDPGAADLGAELFGAHRTIQFDSSTWDLNTEPGIRGAAEHAAKEMAKSGVRQAAALPVDGMPLGCLAGNVFGEAGQPGCRVVMWFQTMPDSQGREGLQAKFEVLSRGALP